MNGQSKNINRQMKLHGLNAILMTGFLAYANSSPEIDRIKEFKDATNPPGLLASSTQYTTDKMTFADVDGDGAEEFIGIERPIFRSFASISRLANRIPKIEWSSNEQIRANRFLVGNIDNDHLPELVLLDEWGIYSGRDSLHAIDWNGNGYQIISNGNKQRKEYGSMSGGLISLLDINLDGTNEILLASPSNYIDNNVPEAHLLDQLKIVRLTDNQFEMVFSLTLPNAVEAFVTGDLDGDGRPEIVTVERPLQPGVLGQIAIHDVDPNDGIVRRLTFNKFLWPDEVGFGREVRYMSIFQCGSDNYLHVHTRRGDWHSVFMLTQSAHGGWHLVPVQENAYHVFAEAKRMTMAYSSQQRAFARFIEYGKFEMIPEDHLRTPHGTKVCGAYKG